MNEEELLYREMNEEDPWYMGDTDDDIANDDADEEYHAEYEDFQRFASREDEILYYLNEGDYDVMPHVAHGVLYHNFQLEPGFIRVKLFWSLLESPKDMPLVNVQVYVGGVMFEYKADKGVWKSKWKGVLTDAITQWLSVHIDVDYSDEDKIFKMHIPDAETAEDYLIDKKTTYFDIDGKLYQYVKAKNVYDEYTAEKRMADKEYMLRAKKLTYKEAARRIADGDYEMLPPELPKRRGHNNKSSL